MKDILGIQYNGVDKQHLLFIGSIPIVILWKYFHYMEDYKLAKQSLIHIWVFI